MLQLLISRLVIYQIRLLNTRWLQHLKCTSRFGVDYVFSTVFRYFTEMQINVYDLMMNIIVNDNPNLNIKMYVYSTNLCNSDVKFK